MLKLLPVDVQSRLRSDIAITSVAQCVEELVLNSLDAGAVCIAIRIDMETFTVQIVDNGVGICKENLNLIGERYSTSKCHKLEDLDNLEYFGYRGEALASLCDITTALEIHSRSRSSAFTYCKMFNHGKPIKVEDSKYSRPCPGTTVTAHNLFYNLPVRQKNINDGLELEKIRYRVEGISLINPSISFSLRNDITGHVVLQTQKSNSVLTAFMYLFGGSLSKCLKPLSIKSKDFKIEGYVGKEGHTKKSLQFVYVNGRLVLKTKIHKFVNKVMSNCLLFRKKRFSDLGEAASVVKSSPRSVDKYPMFVMNIKCPYNVYDITFDPRKTLVEFRDWESLTTAVETMVTEFLKAENLWILSESEFKTPEMVSSPTKNKKNKTLTPANTDLEIADRNDFNGTSFDITTFNTSNSLFSKTVQRKTKERDKIEAIGENNDVTPTTDSIIEDQHQDTPVLALQSPVNSIEICADNLLDRAVMTPSQQFTKNDLCDQSLRKSDMEASPCHIASENDSDDYLNEDPFPLKTSIQSNKTHCENNFISLPSDTEYLNSSVMDKLRGKNVTTSASNRNFTAAQKISLKLKEKAQALAGKENISIKVSHALQKFRKIDKSSTVPSIGISEKAVTFKDHTGSDSKAYTKSVHQNCPSLGIQQRSANIYDVEPCNRNHNCSAFNLLQDAALTVPSDRKRTNHNQIALDAIGPKKTKFMTSASFLTTPKTAFVQIRPLLNNSRKIIQERPSSAPSSSSSSSEFFFQKHQIAELFKSPCKRIYPVDHSRCYTPSKYRSKRTFEDTSTNLLLVNKPSPVNSSEPFILPSQGFDLLPSVVPDQERVPEYKSQGFSVQGAQSLDLIETGNSPNNNNEDWQMKESSLNCEHINKLVLGEHYDKESSKNSFEMSLTNGDNDTPLRDNSRNNCNPDLHDVLNSSTKSDTLNMDCIPSSVHESCILENHIDERELSPVRVIEDTFQESYSSFVYKSPNCDLKTVSGADDSDMNIQCGQTAKTVLLTTADSGSVLDILSDISQQTTQNTCDPGQAYAFSVSTGNSKDAYSTDHGKLKDAHAYDEANCKNIHDFKSIVDPQFEKCYSENILQYTIINQPLDNYNSKEQILQYTASSLNSNEFLNPELGDRRSPSQSLLQNKIDNINYTRLIESSDTIQGDNSSDLYTTIPESAASSLNTNIVSFDSNSITTLQSAAATKMTDPDSNIVAFDTERITRSPESCAATQIPDHDTNIAAFDSKPSSQYNPGTNPNNIASIGKDSNNIIAETVFDDDFSAASQLTDLNNTIVSVNSKSSNPGINPIIIVSPVRNSGNIIAESEEIIDDSLLDDESAASNVDTYLTQNDSVEAENTLDAVNSESFEGLWIEMFDLKSGNKYYVNKQTGNTIFEKEWKTRQKNFNNEETKMPTADRNKDSKPVLSLGSDESKHLQDMFKIHFDDTQDKLIKWRHTSDGSESNNLESTVHQMFDDWENPVCQISNKCVTAEVDHCSRSAMLSHQSLHQITFTKHMLSCMQVLGQVDSKFIACLISTSQSKVPNLLVMMDQHAAHERVRLEQFTTEIFEEGCDVIKKSEISPPLVLTIPEEEVRILQSFRNEFQRIGIKFTCDEKRRDVVSLHTLPACIVEREVNEIKRGNRSVATPFIEDLIREHVEYLKTTGGAKRRLPLTIHKILATKACRGAIKFNDNLSREQCKELITALSKCDLPFQCAHGRPSVVPLYKLDNKPYTEKQVTCRPRLDKLMKNMAL